MCASLGLFNKCILTTAFLTYYNRNVMNYKDTIVWNKVESSTPWMRLHEMSECGVNVSREFALSGCSREPVVNRTSLQHMLLLALVFLNDKKVGWIVQVSMTRTAVYSTRVWSWFGVGYEISSSKSGCEITFSYRESIFFKIIRTIQFG